MNNTSDKDMKDLITGVADNINAFVSNKIARIPPVLRTNLARVIINTIMTTFTVVFILMAILLGFLIYLKVIPLNKGLVIMIIMLVVIIIFTVLTIFTINSQVKRIETETSVSTALKMPLMF